MIGYTSLTNQPTLNLGGSNDDELSSNNACILPLQGSKRKKTHDMTAQ